MKEECSVDSCRKEVDLLNLCGYHYAYGEKPKRKIYDDVCKMDGCLRKHFSYGYCNVHKHRFVRYGDPSKVILKQKRSGLARTPTYNSWASMLARCKNPKHRSYKYYGALGIQICDRWLESVSNFVEDMGLRPENMTLDRIDPFGNYEPENCRWATWREQATNKRKHRLVKT